MINMIDINTWASVIGYFGLSAIIFAETGLFFCFFFPGDSLLFTAGMLASRGMFHIGLLIPLFIVTAFLGYLVGYWFGEKLGHWLSHQQDTWYYKKVYLQRAHVFYEKFGKKALLLGRLLPVVRTFIPVVAGIVCMPYRVYCIYNLLGALLWAGIVTLLGYFLGGVIPQTKEYLLTVVVFIIFVSLLPSIVPWVKKYIQNNRS